ncbi:hypothetical protein L9F63_019309 [Diploptera punctata]|uniref:Cyclic nucleotide-binding domain-containing protein n=1 Tax=Diploptera punctata TaxID=6984 RepID=A0AAD8EEU1_DIPPU|nr:hypothetical protein L9F63_019309 [Diploptera punctata]
MIRLDQNLEEPDELKRFIPGKGIIPKIRRYFRGMRLVSYTHPQSLEIFKSPQAIKNERIKQLSTYHYMIHPFSVFRLRWELLMLIVLTVSLTMIPFYLAFVMEIEEDADLATIGMLVLDIFCLFDIGVTFLTGYFKEENKEVHLEFKFVAKRYLRTFFLPDLISSLPLDIIFYEVPTITETSRFYAKLVSLVKVFRIKSLLTYLNRWMARRKFSPIFLQLLRALFLLCLYIHWMTCIAYLIPLIYWYNIRPAQRGSWLNSVGLWTKDIRNNYYYCLYRSVSLVFCNSFGGVAEGTAALYFTMVSELAGFIITAVLIALTDRLTRSVNTSNVKYQEKSAQVREYMRHKMMPRTLQKRIMEYFDFRFQKSYFNEAKIHNILTRELRQDVTLHNCRVMVEHVSFLSNLPTEVLVRIVTCLQIEIYLANDIIFKAGSEGESMYFIAFGTVAMFSPLGVEIGHLEDGDHFGEAAIVLGIKRISSVIAIEHCELYRLDREDFMRVIAPYPDMVRKVEQIAVDRLEYTNQLEDEYRHRRGSVDMLEDDKSETKKVSEDKKLRPNIADERRKQVIDRKPRTQTERGRRN